jgi:hypothetical protein
VRYIKFLVRWDAGKGIKDILTCFSTHIVSMKCLKFISELIISRKHIKLGNQVFHYKSQRSEAKTQSWCTFFLFFIKKSRTEDVVQW